jgi:hypothetical protein
VESLKVTHEVFLQRLSVKNPDVEPLEEYKGYKVNIMCRCKICGNEWSVRPGNLLSGKGCPPCAIKRNTARQTKSQADFLSELAENNPNVDALELYKNINTKILFRCKKCHYEWPAKPAHVLNGHGCPVCGGSMRKNNDTFLAQLAKINPMIEPLEPYTNARNKILCRCNYCKNEWPATPDKLLQGNGCPNCDKRNKTSFPEQAIYFYLRKFYPDTLDRYCLPNSKTEIDIFIPSLKIGIEYDGVYWHKSKADREAKKYQKCREHGITLYRMRESTKVIDGIADAIIIRHKPYNFETLDAALVELFGMMGVQISVNTFENSASIREQFYTELASNSLAALYPEVAEEWHPEKNGAIIPNMVSYGSNVQYWWKCSACQREWFAAVADRTVGGKGCSKCAKAKLSKQFKKKHEVFVEQLKAVNPNLEPLEEYKLTHDNILIRCKVCGHEWPAAPANLLRGRDCPKCSRKRGYAKMAATKREYWRQKKAK